MSTRRFLMVSIVGAATLAMLSGCFGLFPQQVGEENQGGSSVPQVTTKFLNDQWGQMNPDDIQLLVQVAPTFVPELEEADLPEVSDSQAQTLVDFMDANNVETQADLEAVIAQAQADPTSVENYEEVREVLEALVGQQGGS